jgi:asparagine synthase (glutamine-hydrolysing)
MRNQLLRDSDVMSMAWSLELRVPYVDIRLVEAIQRIPSQLRLTAGKRILLDAVPEIPEWVRNRPKQGFVFPFREWITGEWNDVFARIERESPIPLKNWYRRWCLFALQSFLARNGIAFADKDREGGLSVNRYQLSGAA